ncbi:hypothetical protein [Arthrobacter sp. NEB 688]|uniref:hypothetical protein n=1 Tax=Arthrobacter sp. NEB 688 TaxID=904039 RepID=UPI0015672BB3|nr:hypothetical protein [Arthrobacter sp. NEB 688]QKE82517.1 hypothetical protein HL663_00110 [Arthrobacter sp. NEB 688]
MTPTPADLLARHAPVLDPPDDPALDAVLARSLTQDPARLPVLPPRVRRRVLVGAAVAALTGGAVALPAVLRRDDAAVQALQRIARTAGSRPATPLTPGRFMHLVTIDNPDGREFWITGSPGRDVYPRRLESWTAADGTIWRHDTENDGQEYFYRFDHQAADGSLSDVSPSTLAGLPHDGEELLRTVRRRLGARGGDEPPFLYLVEAVRVGYAPPPVQRALVDALSRLDVSGAVSSRSGDGRPCLRVSFTTAEPGGRISYLCFDEATAEFVESGDVIDGRTVFSSVVTARGVVDEVPAEVVERGAGTPQG